jgi:hypothetical protein
MRLISAVSGVQIPAPPPPQLRTSPFTWRIIGFCGVARYLFASFPDRILNMDSERIPRHANGVTAWAVCPIFSGISERTTKNNRLPCMEDSLHLRAGSFKWCSGTGKAEPSTHLTLLETLKVEGGNQRKPLTADVTGHKIISKKRVKA